jgi:hypothetical protein
MDPYIFVGSNLQKFPSSDLDPAAPDSDLAVPDPTLNKGGRYEAKLARLLALTALWVRIQTSLKDAKWAI